MREYRNATNKGVEARGRERLAADLSRCQAVTDSRHAGLDDGGAGIVIGPGDGYRHNGNGTLLSDTASRAIAASNPKLGDPTPVSGPAALAEIRRRDFLRRRPGYGTAPGVDAERAKYQRNRIALSLLRAMVPDEVADQELYAPIADLVADIRRRIVRLDPACCPKCFHELSAEQAHDGGGEPIHGKIDIACEHCDHYERVDSDATNDD